MNSIRLIDVLDFRTCNLKKQLLIILNAFLSSEDHVLHVCVNCLNKGSLCQDRKKSDN